MTEAAQDQAPKATKTVIEQVTMKDANADGTPRVVAFPGKRKLIKESSITADGTVQLRLDFRNGESRLFTVPPVLLHKFAAHGAEQKLGDMTAGIDEVEDQVLAVDEGIDRLYNGEWNERREGNGMAGTSILLQALVELKGKSVDEIKAFLKPKTAAEKLALRNNAKVKPIIERLEAEKAAKKGNVDTDAMLDAI